MVVGTPRIPVICCEGTCLCLPCSVFAGTPVQRQRARELQQPRYTFHQLFLDLGFLGRCHLGLLYSYSSGSAATVCLTSFCTGLYRLQRPPARSWGLIRRQLYAQWWSWQLFEAPSGIFQCDAIQYLPAREQNSCCKGPQT